MTVVPFRNSFRFDGMMRYSDMLNPIIMYRELFFRVAGFVKKVGWLESG